MNSSNKGLTIKDLITTGIFSALGIVIGFVGSLVFAVNPVLTYLLPIVQGLIVAPIFILFSVKVPKRGAISIYGVVSGLLLFITGMYWMWAIATVLLGFIADFIAGIRSNKSLKFNTIAYMLYALGPIASYMMVWINKDMYVQYLVGKGTEQSYMDTMIITAQNWMLPAMIITTLIAALLGSYLGVKLLNKQFKKAGILSE